MNRQSRQDDAMDKFPVRWQGAVRFQKRIQLGRVMRLNLSRRAVSLSVGIRGLRVNISRRGIWITLGVPGSGWSYRGGFAWGWKRNTNNFRDSIQEELNDE
jgi:hypothetical protein